MRDYRSNNEGMMMGLVVGAVLGAGVALLMAPAAGTETRRKLGEAARRAGGDARNRLDDVAHRVKDGVKDVTSHLKRDVRDAVDAGKDAWEAEGNI
jgi:gas vesicle protein